MRRALACAVAGLVTGIAVFTAVGCTADTAGTAGTTGDARGRSQEREPTDAERVLLRRAEETLVKKCMESKGFKYWVWHIPTVDALKGGGYVLTDVNWAKKHGYGSRFERKLLTAQRDDPNHAYVNAMPRKDRIRYSKALEGDASHGMLTAELPGGGAVQTPRDSCQAEAKGRLYGDFETWFKVEKVATNLTALYVPDLLKDKRFASAVTAWSACMREAGHDYADPPKIRAKLPKLKKGLSTEKAYAIEVELATAEAACATETPLADTARTLQTEYRTEKLKPYSADIAAYQRMSRSALDRAEDIIGPTA
ncbi:hypothetical protein [Streptomyces sp. TRM68416]|uniref:hypothetical protein n=1 Tax=Streptomyces sp. TRM68416 TaxID=2758412 RepID=UPI001661F160|nr:hypothetical protein [Streptomyces sp. TRM68416]MBD0838712.1 hypothetical protein [Streptomyces sp. TRM68416]